MKNKIFFLSVIVMSFILSNIVVGSDFKKKVSNHCGGLNVMLDTVNSSDKDDHIWVKYERAPEFIGGGKVSEWVASRLRYPVEALKAKIEGRVYVSFVIEADGSVTNVKVLRGLNNSLDNEAIRVIKTMPKWKPGTLWKPEIKKHKPVRCFFQMPVIFKLDSVDKHSVDSILEEEKVYLIVDEAPEFFKGNRNITEWIQAEIQSKLGNGLGHPIGGIVYTKFIIEKDGSISNIEIFKSPDKDLSEETIKIIKSMPKWKPGKNKGKPVRVSFSMPVRFDFD